LCYMPCPFHLTALNSSGQDPLAGYCESVNELSGSYKAGNLLCVSLFLHLLYIYWHLYNVLKERNELNCNNRVLFFGMWHHMFL
jgi:hypothetical protein